jgi:hypothetical protein
MPWFTAESRWTDQTQQGDADEGTIGVGRKGAARHDTNDPLVCGRDVRCTDAPPPDWIAKRVDEARKLTVNVAVGGEEKTMTMEGAARDPVGRESYVIEYAKGRRHLAEPVAASEIQAAVRWDNTQDPRLMVHMHPQQRRPDFMSWGDKITADKMRVPNAAWSTTRNALMVYVPNLQGGQGLVYMPKPWGIQ